MDVMSEKLVVPRADLQYSRHTEVRLYNILSWPFLRGYIDIDNDSINTCTCAVNLMNIRQMKEEYCQIANILFFVEELLLALVNHIRLTALKSTITLVLNLPYSKRETGLF